VESRFLLKALGASVLATSAIGAVQHTPDGLPPRLESYLASVAKPTPADRMELMGGAPITKLLDGDESKEVAVFGAIWIDAPIARYVELVKDIETFERGGGFKVTRRISTPPRLEDFDQLHLPDEDLQALRVCRVGSCKVKLGEQALQRFRAQVDWNSGNPRAAADLVMRRLAFEYVTRYLEGGNERLPVYRDRSRPTVLAEEFRAMTEQMAELTTYMPTLRSYLLHFPKVTLPGSTSFLYWQETEFGLKPTIRISHLTIREGAEDTVVVSKMLYASHYFLTGVELRVLRPDPSRGPGFWFTSVNRSRSDGLSGFRGMFVRGRVRSEVQESALAGLRRTKEMLESAR